MPIAAGEPGGEPRGGEGAGRCDHQRSPRDLRIAHPRSLTVGGERQSPVTSEAIRHQRTVEDNCRREGGRRVSAISAGSAATQDRLVALVSPVVREAGYDLEGLVLTPMGRRSLLRVVIDRDEGISLDDIAGMSHALAEVLDEDEGVIGKSPYVLEVTSPGVDRPLTEARHWRRAVGRLVEVPVRNASSAEDPGNPEPTVTRGRIAAFDGAAVTLCVDGAEQTLQLADLGAGRVQLEFHRPDEAPKRERPRRQPKLRKGRAVQAEGAP